jgi:hypothetical protein
MEKPEQESGKWLVSVMGVMIFLALVFGILISIAYIYGMDALFPSLRVRETWGVVGDFFGGILNPVFAFLGLIMLLATLYQSQKELALTRKELASSTKALEDQALTQKQQRFENTFFELLNQHNQLIRDMNGLMHKPNISWMNSNRELDISNNAREELEGYLCTSDGAVLRSYFIVLFQALKMIFVYFNGEKIINIEISKIFELTEAEKRYSNIVRAFINDRLGCLLVVNCLPSSNEEYPSHQKFKWLLERYSFFEHVPINYPDYGRKEFFEYIVDQNCFHECAFGDRYYYEKVKNRQPRTLTNDPSPVSEEADAYFNSIED